MGQPKAKAKAKPRARLESHRKHSFQISKRTKLTLHSKERLLQTKAPTKELNKSKSKAQERVAKKPVTKKKGKVKRIAKAMGKKIARVKQLPAVQRMARSYAETSAAATRKLDRLQARAPPWLAKTMNAVRTYSLVSLAAFNLTYLQRDAKFLGTFFAANAAVSYGVLPAAVTVGLDPLTSTVLNLMSTPITIAVLVLRDRHLKRKAGTPVTLAESARSILSDYRKFATQRKADSSARALAMAAQ